MCGDAQIDPVVVQAAAVLVIDEHPFRRVQDHPVHEALLASDARAGVARPAAPADRAPDIPAEPFVISRINRGAQPVDIDQWNQPGLRVFLLFRVHPRRKLPAGALGLDSAEPSRPLLPARADQQRLAPVLHVHGIPAVGAAAVRKFVVHTRDP
jgi:hypothetical protein